MGGHILFSTLTNESLGCPNGSKWIWETFRQCTEETCDYASAVIGMISMAVYVLAAIPQIIKSARCKNMDKAISIGLLLCILGGDACNLIGCFLAHQLPIQIWAAVLFTTLDLIMIGMFCFFKYRNRNKNDDLQLSSVYVFLCLGTVMGAVTLMGPACEEDALVVSTQTGRRLLATRGGSISMLLTRTEVIGLIIGSVSTCSYIGGRCFQIYRNYKRRSVEGVSFLLFLFLVVGNAMYLLGLFLKDPPARRTKADYILAHVSWLLGSGIQLVLDIIVS
uniref:Solute carrier family 66 member 1 n=1 Tax=Latimeria chalumnae TaxID=7897 RepID=H3A870_LATCH